MEAGKRIPLLDIGAGVYPTTLFFNHSCAPNTIRINQVLIFNFPEKEIIILYFLNLNFRVTA